MKLNILIIAITLFALSVLGGLSYMKVQSIFEKEIEELTKKLVYELSGNISNDMKTYKSAASIISKSLNFQNSNRKKNSANLINELKNYADEFPEIANVYVGYKDKSLYNIHLLACQMGLM